jgi:hypothetical protein
MLTIQGRRERFCDGVSRRHFLKIGASGIGGLGLADLLRLEARAGTSQGLAGEAAHGTRQRSIINIYLPGGPSHMDLFDIKTGAPAEFRGEFGPIATNVPGIEICEHLPRLARLMDKLVVIRSVADMANEHASSQSDSGWSEQSLRSIGGRPSLGSVISKLQGASNPSAPAFVQLSGRGQPGFLGALYGPYRPDGPGLSNLRINGSITLERLDDRNQLLADLDRVRRDIDRSGAMDALDTFNQRAVGVITSSALADAFDLTKEDPRLRERYGDDAPPEQGRRRGRRGRQSNARFLQARRLIEAGVRCVSFSWGGWDTHGDNFNQLRQQLPELDEGLSALVEDLDNRGLLDDVMILMSGEFGRTPRVNGGAGRDHWPQVGCALVAGGGMRMGQAIGTTNRLGEFAQDRPVHLQEIFATLYHQLGIDPAGTTLIDPNGRPQYLVDIREPMPELVYGVRVGV